MASNTLWQASEKVRPKIESWTNDFTVILKVIAKAEVEMIGERDYRIPVELSSGGRFRTYDLNFGDKGRGSSSTGDYFVGTWFPLTLNFEISDLKKRATDSKEKALRDEFKNTLKKAIPEFAMYREFSFLSDGTAKVGTVSAVATHGTTGNTVYTMAADHKLARIRRGMYLTVYAASYASIRAQNVFVKTIDYRNGTIEMSQAITGAANTDILCYDGVSGTGSAPAWQKGLYYVHDDAESGYYLGMNRALEPEVISNSVDVSSNAVNVLDGMRLLDQMGTRLGSTPKGLRGFWNVPQRAQVYHQLVQAAEWSRTRQSEKVIDRLPELEDTIPFCGIPHTINYRHHRQRIDWLVPETWGVSRFADADFHEDENGNRFWTIAAPSGAPAAGTWFGLHVEEDYYNVAPRKAGFLKNCAVPTNY